MKQNISNKLSILFTRFGFYTETGECVQNIIVADKNSKNRYYPFSEDNDLSIFDKEQLNYLKPDAVFVLYNRPYILFYETTLTKKQQADIWMYDTSPIVVAVDENENTILYNVFNFSKDEGLEKIKDENIDNTINLQGILSGKMWENWVKKCYEKTISAQRTGRFGNTLLDNIRTMRNLLQENKLSEKNATTFILRIIFIRYLLDREVSIGQHIEGETVEERRNYFHDMIIDKKRLFALFNYIDTSWMNGDLFKNEINIDDTILQSISTIFKGGSVPNANGQQILELYFDIFDFGVIPVEIISGIYESVLNPATREENAAIYTPPFLVEYILKHTLDKHLKEHNTIPTILDPSMGSGIFLVQSFRHIVRTSKTFQNFDQKKESKERIDFLKNIIKNHIFGVDIDESAVNVTAFSLYIALLDFLRPVEIEQIAESGRLPNLLGENLFFNDFFNQENAKQLELFEIQDMLRDGNWSFTPYNRALRGKSIDFIIGNPPWKQITDGNSYFRKYIKVSKKTTTQHEIAQGFLWRSLDFCAKDTECALIVTSKVLHNLPAKEKENDFKKTFFEEVCLSQIMDLSAVRRFVFKQLRTEKGSDGNSAIGPAAILFYKKATTPKEARKSLVLHTSIKNNIFFKYFRTLVLEQEDIKKIRQSHFIDKSWMFKVALYGTALDFNFLKRLKNINTTIDSFIEGDDAIFKGDGIVKIGSKNAYFPFLEGLKQINLNEIKELYYTHIPNNIMTAEDTFLARGRKIEIFEGEKILLKTRPLKESNVFITYSDETSVYPNKTLGITSKTDVDTLKFIYALMCSDLYTYFLYSISIGWGIGIPEINNTEYLSFPLAEISQKTALIDCANSIINAHKNKDAMLNNAECDRITNAALTKINEIVADAYDLDETEKDLIAYVLEISRYQFQTTKNIDKKYLRRTTEADLRQYANVYIDYFGQLFDGRLGEYFQVTYYMMPYFVAMRFEVVENKPQELIKRGVAKNEKELFAILSKELTLTETTSEIFTQQVVKGFDKKSFYIIKPNQYKSWHRANAHLDASSFDDAIIENEIAQGGVGNHE